MMLPVALRLGNCRMLNNPPDGGPRKRTGEVPFWSDATERNRHGVVSGTAVLVFMDDALCTSRMAQAAAISAYLEVTGMALFCHYLCPY